MLREKLAAVIEAGSTTVKVANEAPGDLAGGSMARGGRVFLERLGAPPEGVPKLEQGRPGHCCLCPIIGHTSFYVKYNPNYTKTCQCSTKQFCEYPLTFSSERVSLIQVFVLTI